MEMYQEQQLFYILSKIILPKRMEKASKTRSNK